MAQRVTNWKDEAIAARLADLWSAGHSCSTIARMLGNGVTRNSVIGAVSRAGLPKRTTLVRQRHTNRALGSAMARLKSAEVKSAGKSFNFATSPNMVRSPGLEPLPLPMPAADDVARVSFADLDTKHCRWPVGETGNVSLDTPIFCGLDRIPGGISSYCPGHHARATVPVRPRPPAAPMVAAPVIEKQLEAA
jgi:hypothetical protein